MKLFGNSKRSRHSSGRSYRRDEEPVRRRRADYIDERSNYADDRSNYVDERPKKKKKKKKKKKSGFRKLVTTLFVLLAIGAGVYAGLKIYVRPPDVDGGILSDSGTETAGREKDKYTFLLLGKDVVSGNTDTIMIGMFDAKEYTLNVVSIPRDTLVNVYWSTKKANTLYTPDNMDETMDGFANLLGYEIDFYGVVDLEAFVHLVDAIGGVWYDVPDVEGNGQGMNYEDPEQDLYIHLEPGYQLLNGEQAIGIVRYRKGYANQDIGRIESQQHFLMAAAEQILANKDSISVTDLISVFLKYVETDLDYGECAWFAKELMKMDSEDIQFHTLPGNYNDTVNGRSYVTIYVDEWLEMINTYLNPFNVDIQESNLDILTRDPETNKIYSTSGVYADSPNWGN